MQKLTSLGTLAGGIAHDFNNIMMGLFGNIALAKNEFPKDHSGYKVLEDAEKSMGRAIRLTKQLLIFAKGGEPVKESISLGALVEDVVKFDLAGSNVRCEFSQAPDLWTIKADKGQVQQVISNLTINAREAMPNGGHFYVSLENVELKDEDIASLKHGKFIKLVVRDEGVGIDSKMTERIFDPYFPAEGVCAVMGEKGVAVIPARLNATTRILILDDEEVIRMVVPRWLKRAGCSVVAAADGQQALTLYKQALNDGVPFDVGILDLTIPGGIGGVEVAKAVLAFQPEARLIASSGYADGAVMSNFAAYGFKGVIAKPYTEDQLREVLDKILA
jgi:CheY-like chemotaxis protein